MQYTGPKGEERSASGGHQLFCGPDTAKDCAKGEAHLTPRKIRRLRVKAGLTQRELGDKLQVSQVLVSHWETERSTPSPAQRKRLEQILGGGKAQEEEGAASPTSAWLKKARISKELSVPELAA